MQDVPTIGRTVIVLGIYSNGADRAPAVITRSWGGSHQSTAQGPIAVNLTVFPDGGPPECHPSVMLFNTQAEAIAQQSLYGGKVAHWPLRVS